MYKKIPSVSILFLLALTIASCRENSPPAAANNAAGKPPAAAASPTVSGGNSITEPPAKYYNGKGKVTGINMEIGSVELDHEEIPGLMPKMTMEFYAADKSALKDLKIGDRVDFVLEDKAGAEKISSIKKARAGENKK